MSGVKPSVMSARKGSMIFVVVRHEMHNEGDFLGYIIT